jgi:hypothetical protein
MVWWWRRPSIQRWPVTREAGKLTRSKPASSGVKRGRAHRSLAVHGVGGRAGMLDGDSVAQRSMVAVDEP